MSYRADKLVIDTYTDTQTHRRNRWQYPKLASGKKGYLPEVLV